MNTYFFRYFFLFSFVLFLSACVQEKQNDSPVNSGISEKISDTLKNDFAKGFRIVKSEKEVQIDVLEPVSQKVIQRYFFSDNLKTDDYFSYLFPIEKMVTTSTSHLGMIRKLEEESKVAGVSDFRFLCTALSEEVVEVGEMGWTNPEAFVRANPEIIFYSGFNLEDPILNKLKEARLKTFLVYDWKEMHPLGRAEWIKVFGVILNKEKQANDVFEEVKTAYFSLVEKLKTATRKPSVLVGTYYSDVFNAPAGGSYMAQLFKEANVDYKYAETEGTGSLSLTLEEVITKNMETEFWLNVHATEKEELLAQNNKFRLIKAVQEGNLYSYSANLNCFFENSSVMPHLLLRDLGIIFHPELFENQELEFYTKVE